jgi:esterase/lipase superfamily enzyme
MFSKGDARMNEGCAISAVRRRRPARIAILLLLACGLAGCATRPGPEVLNPVPTLAPGVRIATVYVATTRAREIPDSNIFNSARARGLNYAEFKISIPPRHRPGQIEWPNGAPDPATSFTTVQQTVLDRQTFEQRIAQSGNAAKSVKAGVFVHGFNTNFQEALYRLAQMTADSDVDGVPILFAWPSEARVTGYVADKDAVTYSRDQLVDLLTLLARKRNVGEITVFAHSMGGWLTAEALRQLRVAGNNAIVNRLNVVLAAPDIDVDVFRAQMEVIGPLSPPMTVLVSRDDIALSIASRIAGERQRLGMLDVDDPRVQEAAEKAKLRIIDISSLKASDGFNHDRYVSLAALYHRLAAVEKDGAGHDLRRAGAFIFNTVGTTLSSPFSLTGRALAGE